jgi:hypothetical protein
MRRSATKLLRYVTRDRGAADSEDEAREPLEREEAGGASGPSAARYDKLPVEHVLAHLKDLGPADLARLGDHERAHRNRVTLLAQIDALLGNEPWPGYDALDVDGVRFGLDGARRDRFVTVLAYERAHKNRAGVVLAAQQNPARDGA